MRLTSFVVSRSWASNPLRTALTILGIGLGVAIVVAIHIMDHNTIQSRLMEQKPERGAVELELHALERERSPEAVRQDLEHRDGIEGLALWLEADVRVGPHAATLYGLDPLPGGLFSHYRVQQGEDLGPGGEQSDEMEVLVGIELAQTLGVVPGGVVELRSAGQRTVCRDGVPEVVALDMPDRSVTVRVRGILAYELLGRRDLGQVIVGSHSLARLFAPESETLYQIQRVYGANLDRLQAELEEDYLVLDQLQISIGERADERAFRNGVKVLGCLALILGMFVVFQTLSQSLVERLSHIGLLRCLGASRGTIAGIFLVDALAMAVVGTVLGVGGGTLFALGLRSQEISSLGMLKPWLTFELPVEPILWTAALGILFTLAGAAFPLWRASGIPPLSALASRGLDPGGRGSVLRGVNLFLFVLLVVLLPLGYLAMTPLVSEGWETVVVLVQMGGMILVFGLVLLASPRLVSWLGTGVLLPLRRVFPLVTFLMVKTLRRNPGRIAASVCGLSVVLLALVSLKSITYALRSEVRDFAVTALDQRLFLETEPVTAEHARTLAQVPGVAAVDPLEGRVQAPFPISGLGLEVLIRNGGVLEPFPEEASLYLEQRSLLVSPRLAKLHDLREGGAVSVVTDRGPVPYTVLRITDRAGFVPDERAWAVAAPRWMRQDFCIPESSVRRISLDLEPDANAEQVQRAAAAIVPVQGAKTGTWIRDYHLRDVSRDFFIFDILLGAILCLAIAGLINSMTIAALGRVREIGVIRALGMGRRDLRRLFLTEGVLVALVSTVFVLALGVPMGQLVVSGLNRVARLDAPFTVPWLWLAVVPVLALGAGLCASILPGLRACRQDPAASVRYE